MDKVHLITYGNDKYNKSKIRIMNEANETKWFTTIRLYEPQNISDEFYRIFSNVLGLKRGNGYWLWKLDIIRNRLNEIGMNEFLVYLDCGCSINKNGRKRFLEYINMLKNSEYGIISFQMGHKEKEWTTKEIFEIFEIPKDSDIKTTGQFVGGILIMRKTPHTIKLFDIVFEKLKINPLIITDHYNKNQNEYFKDNRHDQSIFSVARKKVGSIILPDETFQKCKRISESLYPFLATRKRC